MDPAEFRFIRKAYIKERTAEVVKQIRPSPFLWEPFKVRKRTSNGAHSSVRGLYSLHTAVGNGAMNKFVSYCLVRNEHFKPTMLLFSVATGAMNDPRHWELGKECLTDVGNCTKSLFSMLGPVQIHWRFYKDNGEAQFCIWKSQHTKMPPFPSEWWIFIPALAICF